MLRFPRFFVCDEYFIMKSSGNLACRVFDPLACIKYNWKTSMAIQSRDLIIWRHNQTARQIVAQLRRFNRMTSKS